MLLRRTSQHSSHCLLRNYWNQGNNNPLATVTQHFQCCHQTCSNQRTITVSVPFPIFNLPSRIPCSEAVQRGIVREIDIQGVCSTFPEPTAAPYPPTSPINPNGGHTGYPYTPSWTTASPGGSTPLGATVNPGPSDAYVVSKSSSGTLIGAFFTILIASILCL